MSMMLIVGILKVTGLFQWLAYRSYRAVRGNAYLLMVLFMAITAVISAFLDNVTTMLLIVPVTIQIARSLKLNPLGLLVPEVFASNIGGTATLIGDPPNIMIGSAAGLSFLDFVVHLASICLICLAVSMVYFLWFNRRSLASAQPPDRGGDQDYGYGITDKRLLIKTLAVLAMVIGLFFVHGSLGMEPSIAALMGAAVLIAISHSDIARLLEKEIEWPTLVFFMMLFVVVGGAKETGLIDLLVLAVQDLAQGSLPAAVLIILWSSALASAVIDNIPYTATIIPIVASLNQTIPGAESGVLWWALALGGLSGGQRHHGRGQRQPGHGGAGQPLGLRHLLYGLPHGQPAAHADNHRPVLGLAAGRGRIIPDGRTGPYWAVSPGTSAGSPLTLTMRKITADL